MEKSHERDSGISKAALEAISTLLPSKSRDKYEQTYNVFNAWRTAKKVTGIDEEVMLAYFHERAEKLKSSTLWSTYSMLKSTLKMKENVDIARYGKLLMYLKRQGEGYESKKAKILSMDNVLKFLTKAPEDSYLLIKVALIFGLYGACRSQELKKLNVEDIDDSGSVLVVTLHDTKTKKKRIFTVTSEMGDGINEIELYRRYLSLRPKHTNHSRFFVFYKNNKCSIQPVGIHSFYSMPRKIASYLELPEPEQYTGHCLRRTSTTFLAEGGADIRRLKDHGGWRSSTTAEGYIEDSINNKLKTSKMLFTQQPMSASAFPSNSLDAPSATELHSSPSRILTH